MIDSTVAVVAVAVAAGDACDDGCCSVGEYELFQSIKGEVSYVSRQSFFRENELEAVKTTLARMLSRVISKRIIRQRRDN